MGSEYFQNGTVATETERQQRSRLPTVGSRFGPLGSSAGRARTLLGLQSTSQRHFTTEYRVREIPRARRLPVHCAGPVDEGAGRAVRVDGGQLDDGVGALGNGIGAAATVEVGGGETGVGGVDAHTRQ